MGNYTVRRNILVGWQIDACQMLFQGKTDEEIIVKLFNADLKDKKDRRNKLEKLRRFMKSKRFEEYYKSMITEWTVHNTGRALNKLTEQLDHDQPWLANKAANDILQRVPKSMFAAEDENTIKVVVEGAPALGTPEDV